ncbi:hypothetical protein V5799_002968 [Amblyomma americanum]|uniref:Uncharacterized protein n=1 Tax=Amblyomma americanum TaxID=6943 RepID=A0AAQ4DAA9_AMBAM
MHAGIFEPAVVLKHRMKDFLRVQYACFQCGTTEKNSNRKKKLSSIATPRSANSFAFLLLHSVHPLSSEAHASRLYL